ncbi:MAG TPA: GGDEF domain-containing protein [Burkholderiaceae bacterium]|nr:GGDEF domain-containing protein [Burkholderiaceae bacterium]
MSEIPVSAMATARTFLALRRPVPAALLIGAVVLLAIMAAGVGVYGWLHPANAWAVRMAIGVLFFLVFVQSLVLLLSWLRVDFHNARLVRRLGYLVHEDALTGVVNRRGLDERLPQEMARAKRSGAPLTVAMLDLDYFKRFNDRRGHGAADVLLREAAQAWRRQLRPSDLLARYGGEEFTLVLPACEAEQAEQLIERLRPVVPEHQTFSAGVATWNGQDSMEELLRTADIALLTAKKEGRNRTVVAGREKQIRLPLRVA